MRGFAFIERLDLTGTRNPPRQYQSSFFFFPFLCYPLAFYSRLYIADYP